MGALVHFNMMTYGSCSPDAAAFDPAALDTDQWAASFAAMGAREAVLVAKHGCGFALWPSNAPEPDGSRYNYSVASTPWMGGRGDVVQGCNCIELFGPKNGPKSYLKRIHTKDSNIGLFELLIGPFLTTSVLFLLQ